MKDRVALVTGAWRGLGRAMALAFAAEGADVAVSARSAEALDELAERIGAMGRAAYPVAADLGEEAEIARLAAAVLERFGRVDILVNNAAIIHPRADLVDFDPALWRAVVDVNLIAPALLIKAVLPSMIERRSGKRSEKRVSRDAGTDLGCRLLL